MVIRAGCLSYPEAKLRFFKPGEKIKITPNHRLKLKYPSQQIKVVLIQRIALPIYVTIIKLNKSYFEFYTAIC